MFRHVPRKGGDSLSEASDAGWCCGTDDQCSNRAQRFGCARQRNTTAYGQLTGSTEFGPAMALNSSASETVPQPMPSGTMKLVW